MHDKIIAPFYIPEFAGKYSRILWSTTSFAPDNYQPWSSSKDKGTNIAGVWLRCFLAIIVLGAPRPQYTVYSVDGPDGGYHIRVSRTAHQKNSDFRKEVNMFQTVLLSYVQFQFLAYPNWRNTRIGEPAVCIVYLRENAHGASHCQLEM